MTRQHNLCVEMLSNLIHGIFDALCSLGFGAMEGGCGGSDIPLKPGLVGKLATEVGKKVNSP